MPYIKLATNVDLDAAAGRELCEALTALASKLLGKPASYVMAHVEPGAVLTFAGSHDPAAFMELRSIGLDRAACAELAAALCGFLNTRLAVPPGRVFIDFRDIDPKMFGWNSKVF